MCKNNFVSINKKLNSPHCHVSCILCLRLLFIWNASIGNTNRFQATGWQHHFLVQGTASNTIKLDRVLSWYWLNPTPLLPRSVSLIEESRERGMCGEIRIQHWYGIAILNLVATNSCIINPATWSYFCWKTIADPVRWVVLDEDATSR
jgi:hypothetical protein